VVSGTEAALVPLQWAGGGEGGWGGWAVVGVGGEDTGWSVGGYPHMSSAARRSCRPRHHPSHSPIGGKQLAMHELAITSDCKQQSVPMGAMCCVEYGAGGLGVQDYYNNSPNQCGS